MSICRIVLQKLSIYTVAFTAIFRNICTAQYTTRIDPHADNVHQVWSWYDHTLPSYSVFVCWYVTWRFDLDYWPFVLEQLSYMVGHVTNPATKFEDPTTIRSWVTSYNASHWLLLKMRARPLRMRRITWPASIGSKKLHFWNPRPRFAYSLYNFYWVPTTIKGRLLTSRPMLKPFSGEKILSRRNGAQKWQFFFWGGMRGQNLRYWFRDPQKALPCGELRRLTYFASKSVLASWR